MTQPGRLPWRQIAKLAVLSVPATLIVVPFDVPQPTGLVGFMTGFLASLYGRYLWAFGALAVAIVAASLSFAGLSFSPVGAVYGVALLLCVLVALAMRHGGRAAMVFAAFGWVFLLFSSPSDVTNLGVLLGLFGLSGVWGIIATRQLRIAGMMAPAPDAHRSPYLTGALATGAGFLVTIALADSLPISRPYWIPFVYLQVVATTDLSRTHIILRRMFGALIGAAGAFALMAIGVPVIVQMLVALMAFAFALRHLMSLPMLSRALTTMSVILIVLATDDSALSARLLAEVSAAAILLVVALILGLRKPPAKTEGASTTGERA